MAASTKAQLGARVSPELREAVVARAKSEGLSLNVWVERTLGAALREPGALAPVASGRERTGSTPDSRTATSRRAPAKTDAPETSIEAYLREYR